MKRPVVPGGKNLDLFTTMTDRLGFFVTANYKFTKLTHNVGAVSKNTHAAEVFQKI